MIVIFIPLFSDKTEKLVIGNSHRGANVFLLTVMNYQHVYLHLHKAVFSRCFVVAALVTVMKVFLFPDLVRDPRSLDVIRCLVYLL